MSHRRDLLTVTSRMPLAFLSALLLSVAPPAAGQRVVFDQTGYRLRSIGERRQAMARVVDAAGRPIANAAIRYRVADPAIATVTARGEVVSRKEGLTKVWAVAGKDSASAIVLVEQWPARFSFSPSALRMDAISSKVALKVQMSDSAGVPVASATRNAPCRSLNERIASIDSAGNVVANANGATWIRCADKGLADSIRVDVQQRAMRASVTPKRPEKQAGDTFSLKVRALDRYGKEVTGSRPTWASLDASIVSIDPTTGKALAKSAGQTRVIVQYGDAADTAVVNVTGSSALLMAAPTAIVDSTPKATVPRGSLNVSDLSIVEGDTRKLVVSVHDTSDAPVPVDFKNLIVRTSDTTTFAVRDSGKVEGLKPGSLQVFFRYGTLTDTAVITVLAKGTNGSRGDTTGSSAAPTVNTKYTRPTITPGLPVRYAAQRDSAMQDIHKLTGANAVSTRFVRASVFAGLAAHSSNQVSATAAPIVEDRSGVVYGGRAVLSPFSWLALDGDLKLGTLNATGTVGEPMTLTEASGRAMLYIMPWLGLGGGYTLRSERALALQRWTIPNATATVKADFMGGSLTALSALSVLPAVKYTGLAQSPDMGIAGEAGLDMHRGRIDAGVLYSAERISFPDLAGSSRVDQISTLRFRLGFRLGR